MKEGAITEWVVSFGPFEVDLKTCELRKQGRKVRLQVQQCRILGVLLESAGSVVTREDLRKELWAEDTFVDFDHSLNTAIMRLREALGDSSDKPRFIETLPRVGYRFIAYVEARRPASGSVAPSVPGAPVVVGAVSVVGAGSEKNGTAIAPDASAIAVEEAQHIRLHPEVTRAAGVDNGSPARRRMILGGIVLAGVALIFGMTIRSIQNAAAARVAPAELKSIVVLPLENLSGEKDQEYFADGMTDELIAHLAKIRSLRVISRTSAMEYKGTHKSLSEIASDLKVDAVVEGTVLRSGNRVRITAELIQVATDRHLWAETYESEMGDVLTLQGHVATAIVNEIRIKLTPEDEQRLAAARPVTQASYEDYLKGKYYWNKRSEEGLTKAIDYFQLATEKDPYYALAYAGLADCYSIIGSAIVGTVPSKEVAGKAKAAAERATELDGTLAEAQTSLATVKFNYDWDWPGAASGFQKAIELNPSYATAFQRYSLYLMAMGNTQESLAQMNRARELDPMSVSMNFSLGWRLYLARQYDRAIEQLRNTVDMDGNFALAHEVLGEAYEQKGMYAQAISELKRAATLSQDSPPMLGALGHAYGVAGDKAEARKVLERLREIAPKKYVSPFYVSIVYLGLGENEQAMDWLEKAYDDRSNAYIFLKVDPDFDAVRGNARFQGLVKRLAVK